MKCKNCGFESEGNFCTMCGAHLEPEQTKDGFPQNSAEKTSPDINLNQQTDNPYSANFGQQISNPQINTQQNTSFAQRINNPQPMNFNQQANNPQPMGSGQNISGAQANPQFQNPFQAAPVNRPVPAPPKKRGKAAEITISCILAAVILAGGAIMTISAVINNQPKGSVSGDYIFDSNNYRIGQTANTEFGKVTLKSISPEVSDLTNDITNDIISDKFSSSYSSSYYYNSTYVLEFTFENTTDRDFVVSDYDFNVSANSDTSNYDCSNYAVSGNPTSISIEPNGKKDFKFYVRTPSSYESLSFSINYNYTMPNGNFGTISFFKPSSHIEAYLFDDVTTDFGTVKITDIKIADVKSVCEKLSKDTETMLSAEDYKDVSFYDFTVEVNNSGITGESITFSLFDASSIYYNYDGTLDHQEVAPIAYYTSDEEHGEKYNYYLSRDAYEIKPNSTGKINVIVAIPNSDNSDTILLGLYFNFTNFVSDLVTVNYRAELSEIREYVGAIMTNNTDSVNNNTTSSATDDKKAEN